MYLLCFFWDPDWRFGWALSFMLDFCYFVNACAIVALILPYFGISTEPLMQIVFTWASGVCCSRVWSVLRECVHVCGKRGGEVEIEGVCFFLFLSRC